MIWTVVENPMFKSVPVITLYSSKLLHKLLSLKKLARIAWLANDGSSGRGLGWQSIAVNGPIVLRHHPTMQTLWDSSVIGATDLRFLPVSDVLSGSLEATSGELSYLYCQKVRHFVPFSTASCRSKFMSWTNLKRVPKSFVLPSSDSQQ
jgi:hypothetical protein